MQGNAAIEFLSLLGERESGRFSCVPVDVLETTVQRQGERLISIHVRRCRPSHGDQHERSQTGSHVPMGWVTTWA